jgi:multidrug transporter EmrE-like cation transporter
VEEIEFEKGIMRFGLLSLILLSVGLSALSQIALKAGMTAAPVQAAIATALSTSIIAAVAQSWLVLCGLLSFGCSALVWLVVLARIPLSSAYPFVALGIAITTLAGLLLFNEPFSAAKAAGVLLIVVGVATVALSS